MKITRRSDEELNAMNLIPPGVYPFDVIEARERVSKKGNEMIEIKLRVWDHKGRERIVFDYLLDSMSHKIKHFCEITGLEDKYEKGTLTDTDCINKSGYVDLMIQKSEGYPDKNSVKDYVVKEINKLQAEPQQEEFNDDIPF